RAARQLTTAGQGFFGEDVDLDFERGLKRAGDVRLQDDQVANFDRMQELEVVDRGRDEEAPRVTMARDRPGNVDEVHDRTAQDEAQRIGIVGQHDLDHLGGRLGGALWRQVHKKTSTTFNA